jgi:hypothetical protein
VHVTGFEPEHVPALHVSVCVHASASLHVVPSVTFEYCVVLTLGWHVWHVFVPLLAPEATHAPLIVQPEHPPIDPSPSWQVTVAPEFIRTCAAAIAPVKADVFTVTKAFGATKSACTFAPEFTEIPADESK